MSVMRCTCGDTVPEAGDHKEDCPLFNTIGQDHMANVISMPASAYFTPAQALESAGQSEDLQDILCIGYDKDGKLFIRSSRMTCAEAAFLCQKALRWALSGGQE